MPKNSLAKEAREVLILLVDSIQSLTLDEYTLRNPLLSQSSIGQHTRHIIELFQALVLNTEATTINYDLRKRALSIEENIDYATDCIAEIICALEAPNRLMELHSLYAPDTSIATNFYRELLYNIEHCIHHQAIIKIAMLHMGKTHIPAHFGVAKSTMSERLKV